MTIPQTMKAVLLTGHGGPEMLEYREDVSVPAPGPGEVLVRVAACGMNNTDIWVREGAYGTADHPGEISSWRRGHAIEFPLIQGADVVGRVAAVGEGGDEEWVGKRVVVDSTLYGEGAMGLIDADIIGHGCNGGFAEFCVVPAANVHLVETQLSDTELATFACAYVTAERMLDRAHVVAGETVLVTGASGGVGSALVQLCRARHAVPIAIAGKGKEQPLLDLGAQAVVTRESEDLAGEVAKVAGKDTIGVVADVVAGPLFTALLDILRPEGRYVIAGAIAGPLVQLDLRTVYLKHIEIIGSTQGTRKEFATVLGHALDGKIKALLAGTYPLCDIRRAQEEFEKKNFIGKLVIIP